MSGFEHSRFEIYNQAQHPYKHTLSDFSYSNPAFGEQVTTLEQALDWIMAVLYPQTKASVDTVGDLPAVGNTINDFRVVNDDGDGKAAAYRWEQREGELTASWHKIYDMDWGADSILEQFMTKTQDNFVFRRGYDDVDETGTVIAGALSGQRIYGGASPNTHLTLYANSGDGTGAATGFIQFGDQVRPTADSTFELGTNVSRWLKVWTDAITSGTLTATSGSITDSSGAISFDNENLTTTGSITAGSLTISSGSIVDTSGAISFGDENLTTTGNFTSRMVTATTAASAFATGTTVGNLTLANGSITDTSGTISFGDENLSTTGTLSAGNSTVTRLDSDNIRLDNNTISITNVNGSLALLANGTGVVNIQSAMTTLGQTITGDVGQTGNLTVTGRADVDNLRLDGNTLSTLDVNGDLLLSPNGTGLVGSSAGFYPSVDSSFDLGKSGNVWNKLWLDGSIGGAVTEITVTDLLTLRSAPYRDAGRTLPAQAGDTLFWSGTQWLANHPDTEIDHGELTGLADDDHIQYALLAGRAGGQSLVGGTAASNNLTLDSTSDATKGNLIFGSVPRGSVDNTLDLGTSSFSFKDMYLKGQLFGARLANHTTAGRPSASASNKGRLIYDTDLEDIFLDTGGAWRKVSSEKYVVQDASGWNGVATSVVYTVSSTVSDARECLWALYDNANNFREIHGEISKSQTQVTVSVGLALPAGTYTLVGVG